jgi:Secretion system C-terminal sorting domain
MKRDVEGLCVRSIIVLLVIAIGCCMPRVSPAQVPTNLIISDSGLAPFAAYDSKGGVYVVWQNLYDAVHLKHMDSLGSSVGSELRLRYTDASVRPRVKSNHKFFVTVWENRISNVISFFNTYIEGYVSHSDSLFGGMYLTFNNSYADAIRGNPDMEFMDDSTFVVVWGGNGESTPSPQTGIYGQLGKASGDTVGPNFLITDHIAHGVNSLFPRVIAQPGSGFFFVLWTDNSSGDNQLWGRKFDAHGYALAPSFLISDDSSMTQMYYYSIAKDSLGGFAVVWIAQKDSLSRVERRWYNKDGVASTGVEILTPYTSSFYSGSSTDVSLDEQGRSIVVWEQKTPQGWKIFGQRFLANESEWGNSFRLSNDTLISDQVWPRVILRNGKVFAIWEENGIRGIFTNMDGMISHVNNNGQYTTSPQSFTLLPCYPNPFNPSVTVSFELFVTSQVRVSIYDILGEEQIVLLDRTSRPGTYKLLWDGRNATGQSLPSGAYFVAVHVGEQSSSQKTLLLR